MRLSKVLCRQHIDRMFKAHWKIQGNRVPIDTKAEAILAAKDIPVYDPQELIKEKREEIKLNIIGRSGPKPLPLNKNHPNWKKDACYFYRDTNVLLEGIEQAKIITKTVEIKYGLPEKIQLTSKLPKEIKNKVLRTILSSHLYDAHQEKLPKIKDPVRPQINLPRVYGITQERATSALITKLLQLCENISDKNLVKQRIVMNDAKFFVPLKKTDDLLQFELSVDKILLALKPLDILTMESGESLDLPNMYPIKYTNTLIPEHFYELDNIYPINKVAMKYHPHTIFVYYDREKVKNVYEEEVTESQILGRSLMKTFTAAAAYARQKFGDDVKVLPEPVTLQCIHTDGKLFHFAMLQLNTLDLEEGGIKNIWYNIPRIPMFECCEYKIGVPTVEGYNQDVMKYLLAFYNNV